MSKPTKYRLGPDVGQDEELHDSQGRLIDDSYVDAAVEDAIAQVRGRGRPSLSASGKSPLLRVRLSREVGRRRPPRSRALRRLQIGMGPPRP